MVIWYHYNILGYMRLAKWYHFHNLVCEVYWLVDRVGI